jgi:hypothetical protein
VDRVLKLQIGVKSAKDCSLGRGLHPSVTRGKGKGDKTYEFGNELGASLEGELVDFGLVLVLFLGRRFLSHCGELSLVKARLVRRVVVMVAVSV